MVRKPLVFVLGALLACAAVAQKEGTEIVKDAKLKELKSKYASTKKKYEANKKDAKAKKAYIDATYWLGMGSMYSESLPARVKYKEALTYFREVLKLDPKHKLAIKNKTMIEDIYKQMGRPIPGGN